MTFPMPNDDKGGDDHRMTEYTVTWTIDIDADSPEAAAREALAIQRDPDSWAIRFLVEAPDGTETQIDVKEA